MIDFDSGGRGREDPPCGPPRSMVRRPVNRGGGPARCRQGGRGRRRKERMPPRVHLSMLNFDLHSKKCWYPCELSLGDSPTFISVFPFHEQTWDDVREPRLRGSNKSCPNGALKNTVRYPPPRLTAPAAAAGPRADAKLWISRGPAAAPEELHSRDDGIHHFRRV